MLYTLADYLTQISTLNVITTSKSFRCKPTEYTGYFELYLEEKISGKIYPCFVAWITFLLIKFFF